MPDRLTLPDLESYLWGAATILRGLVDAGDYKQYVFPLLFYKRLSDVWDEEYVAAFAEGSDEDYARDMADERFIIPAGAHWNEVRAVPSDVGQAIRAAMRVIIVERIVNDIDEIVRHVRFPGWQTTSAGEREIRQALRRTLFKYKLHQDKELFEKAFGSIKQYY
jgi:type I restriction-modification system DNA methylase subunit